MKTGEIRDEEPELEEAQEEELPEGRIVLSSEDSHGMLGYYNEETKEFSIERPTQAREEKGKGRGEVEDWMLNVVWVDDEGKEWRKGGEKGKRTGVHEKRNLVIGHSEIFHFLPPTPQILPLQK